MGQKRRVEVPGGIFHVTSRGNVRAEIFRDELDYLTFLRMLGAVVVEFAWLCRCYCLLPNHFHLLVETPAPNLGRGMQLLNGRYARRFNARNARVGHVFQGPYGAEPVSRDEHLLETYRYIALNPVRAGLCSDPAEWAWGSYQALAGLVEPASFLALDCALALFGSADGFRRFVAGGLDDCNLVETRSHPHG
jgi:putative transposase